MTDEPIGESKAIHRTTGRTFYVATRLLPERVRRATYALYAFFRIADEVVDDADPGSPAEQRAALRDLRAEALGEREPDDPVMRAFRATAERHDIPDAEIEAFLDAMAMDVTVERYDTFADLEGYLRGSSVAVAYMMLAVMDPAEPAVARPHAAALGEAFQLTNFLRDVREDVTEYDRIYLPRETLAAYGVPERRIEDLEFGEGVAAAVRSELRRAERRYRHGVAGIEHLPADCQFPVLVAAVLYAEHHRLIRERGYDTLSATPGLSAARRLALAARTWWHWRRLGDPVAVFERVSAIPGVDSATTGAGRVARLGERAVARPARDLLGAVRSLLPRGSE